MIDCVFIYILPANPAVPSRARALECAAGYARACGLPPPSAILADTRGKPRTDGAVCLSVSHSASLWACAAHTRDVGLDIQIERPQRFEAIARRFFRPAEAGYIAQNPGDFFKLWCAKEALVKYHGDGLAGMRRRAAAGEGGLLRQSGGLALHHFAPGHGYRACLCARAGAKYRVIFTAPSLEHRL